MNTFIWLQIFGFIYLGMGLALSFNPQAIRGVIIEELPYNRAAMFCISFMTMLLGAAVIATHPWWHTTSQVIVSLLGWATLIKGFVYLINPNLIERFKPWFGNDSQLKTMGWLCTVLGVVMLAFSTTWL